MLREELDRLYAQTDEAADQVYRSARLVGEQGGVALPALVESVMRYALLDARQQIVKSMLFKAQGRTYTIINVSNSK